MTQHRRANSHSRISYSFTFQVQGEKKLPKRAVFHLLDREDKWFERRVKNQHKTEASDFFFLKQTPKLWLVSLGGFQQITPWEKLLKQSLGICFYC